MTKPNKSQKMKSYLKRPKNIRLSLWLVIASVIAGMPLFAHAESWLQFCETRTECGYKTASNEVKIEPRHFRLSSAPKVITDEMRANDNLRFLYFVGENPDVLVGYINPRGETVIPPIYERHFSQHFSDGYAIVKKDGLLRLINKEGQLSPLKAERIVTTSSTPPTFFAKRNETWEITDFNGVSVNGIKYSNLKSWDDETKRVTFEENGKFGLSAYDGTEISPAIYDRIDVNDTSFAFFERDEKTALFNVVSGEQVTDFIYDNIHLPRDRKIDQNAIVVVQNGKTGLIDFDGNALTEFKYDYPAISKDSLANRLYRLNFGFSEGLVPYVKGNRAGYLDQTGNIVLEHKKYISVKSFRNGVAEVALKNGQPALINREGDILLRGHTRFSQEGDYINYNMKNKNGLMDNAGNVLIKPEKQNLGEVYNDQYIPITNKKKKQGLFKFDNKALNSSSSMTEIVPSVFDKITIDSGFIFVEFGDQKHPMQLDGTPIGFSLEDVSDQD